jgi:hypothetical protein
MTTIKKGSAVIKPADGGIAIVDSTEIALSNDGSAVPVQVLLHGADGAGLNVAGADLMVRGGASTGSASGGDIVFGNTPAGSSGSTENAPSSVITIKGSTGRVVMEALANGGLVLPVLTTTQINAMSAPVEGQLVYDVTAHKLKIRVAAACEAVTST